MKTDLNKMSSIRCKHGKGRSCYESPAHHGSITVDSNELPGFRYDPIRKRYFKLSDSPNETSRPTSGAICEQFPANSRTKPTSPSLMKMLHLRERGLGIKLFTHNVKQIKMKELNGPQKLSIVKEFCPPQCTAVCLHLTKIQSNLAPSIAGIYTVNDYQNTQKGQWIAFFSLAHKLIRNTFVEDGRHLTLQPLGPPIPLPTGKVTDACAMINGILVCLVTNKSTAFYWPKLSLPVDHRNEPQCIMTLGKETVFSCAFNETTQNVVFGMETHGSVANWISRTLTCTLFSERQSIFCLAFHPEGQVIFSGTKNGTIFCTDLRDRPATRYAYKIKLGHWAMCHLHVLENYNEILCSGYENHLLKTDLRTRRPVTHFVEHRNEYTKATFTVDEGMGILCCTGQDMTTRLWDLNTGSLLTSFYCPTKNSGDEMALSLFGTSWGWRSCMPVLVTAHRDQMFVYDAK